VSVVMNFLNGEKFINEAIDNVIAQSYTYWELLLVDDGSTDGSTEIALDYAQKYPDKVYYLEHDGHQNKGISASRNLGIRNAKGEYITTLDADDVWVKHKLEQQVEILQAHPEAGMVCGETKFWYGWTGKPEDIKLDYYMHDILNLDTLRPNLLINPPTLLLLKLSGEMNAVSMSNIMLRKQVIEQVGGFEEEFTGMHEDQAFLTKIYLNSPVYLAATCWDFYRQHRESCNHIAIEEGKRVSTELFYLHWLEKYFEENNITNPELLNALQKRIWNFEHPALRKLRQRITSNLKNTVKAIGLNVLPKSDWEYITSIYNRRKYHRLLRWFDLEESQTLKMEEESWHNNRCTPLDQYYIYKFLKDNSKYIKGRVLEIGTDLMAHQYGHENVVKSDLVNKSTNVNAKFGRDSLIDYTSDIPSDTYDCIIAAYIFQPTHNLSPLIKTLYRILKPRGVMLAMTKSIGALVTEHSDYTDQHRHLTCLSVRKMFEEHFPIKNIAITCFGNVVSVKSLLVQLVSKESSQGESDYSNNRHHIVIGVRVEKPANN